MACFYLRLSCLQWQSELWQHIYSGGWFLSCFAALSIDSGTLRFKSSYHVIIFSNAQTNSRNLPAVHLREPQLLCCLVPSVPERDDASFTTQPFLHRAATNCSAQTALRLQKLLLSGISTYPVPNHEGEEGLFLILLVNDRQFVQNYRSGTTKIERVDLHALLQRKTADKRLQRRWRCQVPRRHGSFCQEKGSPSLDE